MTAAGIPLVVALVLSLFWGQKPADEMDARKPAIIILPPPPFIDAKEKDGKLSIRFREIGLLRVQKYNFYRLEDGKWRLMGSVRFPPALLSDCRHGTTSYAIAGVDKSHNEGSRARFTSDYSCLTFSEILKAP